MKKNTLIKKKNRQKKKENKQTYSLFHAESVSLNLKDKGVWWHTLEKITPVKNSSIVQSATIGATGVLI